MVCWVILWPHSLPALLPSSGKSLLIHRHGVSAFRAQNTLNENGDKGDGSHFTITILCYCVCCCALFVTYFVHNVSATVSYDRKEFLDIRTAITHLVKKEYAISGANPTPLITPRKPSPQWSLVGTASCYRDVFHQQGLGNWSELEEWWIPLNTRKFLRETSLP